MLWWVCSILVVAGSLFSTGRCCAFGSCCDEAVVSVGPLLEDHVYSECGNPVRVLDVVSDVSVWVSCSDEVE